MQIKKFLIGLLLGFSLIIPGVSVSATTLIFNVYDDYIELIKKFYLVKIIKKHIFLILGITIGMILTVLIIHKMYKNMPFLLNGIFLGLMCFSMLIEHRKTKENNDFNLFKLLLGCILIISVNLILYFLKINNISYLSIFFAAFFSSLAFIIPGISGGLILISFNLYYYFINILHQLLTFNLSNFNQLLFFIIFLIIFIFINTHLIKIRSRSFFIIGLLIGSISLMFYEHIIIISTIVNIMQYLIGFIIGWLLTKLL